LICLKKTTKFSVVFRYLGRTKEFQNKHKTDKKHFTRSGKLGFNKTLSLILKKSNKSSQNSLNDMTLNLKEESGITNSAYTQARAKLNYTAFQEFANLSAQMFYEDGEYERYKDFRLLAIDGSIVILPNSENIKQEFNPTIAKCQIEDFTKEVVQARVSVLYDVLNGIAIDSSINNKVNNNNNSSSYDGDSNNSSNNSINGIGNNNLIAKDERTLAIEHLMYCNKNDLLLLDRGYPSYKLFALFQSSTNFVIRIKRTSFKEVSFLFAPHCEQKDIVVQLDASKTLTKDGLRELLELGLPTKINVRFVQVVLDNGVVEVLATNILDNTILQTSDFKELYAKRWGIETYYDLIKNRLSLENFTGLTALAVKQDFFATIFITNYEAMMVYDSNIELEEKTKDNKHTQKVNKAVSLNIIKNKIFDLFYSNKPINKMIKEMEKLFLTNTIIQRPNRKSKPRLDKEKHKSTIATNSINHLKRAKKSVGN